MYVSMANMFTGWTSFLQPYAITVHWHTHALQYLFAVYIQQPCVHVCAMAEDTEETCFRYQNTTWYDVSYSRCRPHVATPNSDANIYTDDDERTALQ